MTFTSNGLLGPTTISTISNPVHDSFQSNGLLDGVLPPCVLPVLKRVEDTKVTFSELLDSQDENVSQENTNPILEELNFPGSSSQSQGDSLPGIAEFIRKFAPPPRFDAHHATLSQGQGVESSFPSQSLVYATTYDGKKVHFKRKTRKPVPVKEFVDTGHRYSNLLEVPIHRLMDQLAADAKTRLDHCNILSIPPKEKHIQAIEDELWVDRHRPNHFTDLTGNERVAREVMTWLKKWDWCVFGRRRSRKRNYPGPLDENSPYEDEYHRPREKLLLLSGPPGLGKTTLVHVIARQAGYEVLEINASDARTGSIVEDKIKPALESGSGIRSTKPVLLVIDEIDGATGAEDMGFIPKLVQLTQDNPRKPGRKRGPKDKRPLLRPIICICNDGYASSLAKLRLHCLHIRISRPADSHVVKRLQEICELENLKTSSRALSTLVGVAKGDLRGCLNTLQFIKSREEEVTEAVVREATRGMKEVESSATSALNSLFMPLTRKRVKELGLSEEAEAKYVARLSRDIESSGRDITIASGCFAHYITLHQHDANFSRYEKANEWLVAYDTLSGLMYNHAIFELQQYLPFTLVPFYPLFQERGGQPIEKSQADWEHFQTTKANEEIYKSLSPCLKTIEGRCYRHLLSTPTLQLEFAPLINRIISPPLRPVNSQVIKKEERALLSRLVNIMVALELQFVQERGEDGQLTYRLEPPVDVFITYDGKRAADIAISRYAVRHLVAGEIDAQRIVRQSYVQDNKPSKRVDRSSKQNNNEIDIADRPPTDFFGRLIEGVPEGSSNGKICKNNERKFSVMYRYKEGNSAAVRKPVKVSAFL